MFSQSDVILPLLPLTHGENPAIALHSKMLMALLNPLLDCEQIYALKLTQKEGCSCVSLLKKAVEDPCHMAEEISLLTILRALIWFTHEFHRQEKGEGNNKVGSEYESKLVSVAQELRSNISLLIGESVLLVVKAVLKMSCSEELQAVGARFLWSLVHDTAAKAQVLADIEIVECLHGFEKHSSLKLKMASQRVLQLLGFIQADGMCYT